MPNNAWYAFANQALDRSLGMFASSNPDTDAVSMAFSVWEEVGMGANLGSIEGLSSLGTDSIPLKEGVRRFLELFKQDAGDRQIIVTGRLGGIDTWRPEFPALPRGHRFLENVRFFQPGVEVVARTHLTLERDAYLADHEYKDVYLFPTVFGVEAMAQTVAYVLGRPELRGVTISDLDLSRPLPVHPDRGLEIEVYARVIEGESGALTVKTGIRCEQNGFSVDHFAGTFSLGVQLTPDEHTGVVDLQIATLLPVEPQRDLYGPILFQGSRFQRIKGLRHLDGVTCRFESEERETGEYVLGDPFARDALLQSLQLCAIPDQCLPVHVDRWRVTDATESVARVRLNQSAITNRTEEAYVGDIVSTDQAGSILEELTGYRAKILEHRQDWPTAETLALGNAGEQVPATVLEWSAGKAYDTIQGGGPQGQPLFVFRFPLTFRDSATPMSTLYFSSFADWMGKARELGGMQQTEFHPRLFEIFGEGTYGGVTNFFETSILGRAGHSDVVEGRFCMDECTETEYTASCEWRRIPYPSGSPERIAFTRMRTSSVRILGHGVAKPAPWPEDFYEYLVSMRPTRASTRPLAEMPTRLEGLEIGEALWTVDDIDAGVPIARQVFSTSLQDSNLVGNLYFSNYSAWQGRLRDRFLHEIAPECFDLRQLEAQPECLFFSTHHLREAMPFDSIEVHMSVKAMYEGALDLWFDYYRVDMTGTREKLAVGEHRVALVSTSQDSPEVVAWPDRARDRLRLMLSKAEPESVAAETA